MVYDLIYDYEGNVIDAILIESDHGFGKNYVKTKIPTAITIRDNISFGNANHYLYYTSGLNTKYEEGLLEGTINLTQITKSSRWSNLGKLAEEHSILRFILQDEQGNPILNYEGLEYNDSNHNSELINLPDKTKDRLKYSKLYIEKTVNAHADDVVKTNDELTYTIVVKNNSLNNYSDEITVTENLSDYVTYKEYEVNKENISFNKDILNKKLNWNIGKLNSGEEVRIEYTVIVKENCYGETIESTGKVENIPSAIIKNTISNNLTGSQEEKIIEKYNELKIQYNGKKLIDEIYKEALGINLNFNEFEITDLIKNTNTTSTSATTISLNKNNIFYESVLNKYWSTLYSKSYNYESEGDVIGYDLKNWKAHTDNTRRADTIYGENFKTGDILVYKNENDVTYSYKNNILTRTPVTYEEGEYAYIYIEGKGFVGINYGSDGIVGTLDDRNEFNTNYYRNNGLTVYSNESETDENILEFANYQSLMGKDYYVILRPSMSLDIEPMELQINYSTTNKTNEDVIVTITSNEEMWNVEGWTLSEDKKTLTKTYSENCVEELKVYDYGGNEKLVQIKVENIDKDKPENTTNKNTIQNNENMSNDTTTSNKELPNAGEKRIIIFITIFVIIAVIVYIKLKKYKKIT